MVEEIEKSQHGRDDDKEIEKFAKYQMELEHTELFAELQTELALSTSHKERHPSREMGSHF
jgi:hypothetical protein